MSINLKELSTRLGLSPTTVSRALAGYRDVSPTTRERVQQAARAFGYQPNRAARQVAMGRADAIGIIYSPASEFLGNPSFRETLEGLSRFLEQTETDLLLAAAPRQNELRVYERMVSGRRVDALVIAHTLRLDPRIDYLMSAGFPFVAYGRTTRRDDYPWFDFDNEAGSQLAVQHLLALGHRRIAYVHAPLELNFAWERHAGYLQAMRAAGLEPQPAWIASGSLSRRTGHAAAQTLLALRPRPTAVIVDNNTGGIGLIRALLDARVAIGREMSVVVNEGIQEDSLFAPLTVASVLQPTPYRSGQSLGEMVLGLLGRRPLMDRQVLRQPVFVGGSSIGPPAD
jgi:LacI family transcriptional regulator